MQRRTLSLGLDWGYTGHGRVEGARRSTMVDALTQRSLLLRILDVLAEWQMRQSLRAICRSKKRHA